MTRIQPISDQLADGGQPGADELKALREGGFATVVNLRLDGEADQPWPPAEEGAAAETMGLAYHHLPVSLTALDPAQLARLVDEEANTAEDGPPHAALILLSEVRPPTAPFLLQRTMTPLAAATTCT